MYGQIHQCIKKLVILKFGDEAWDKIVKESGLDEINHFMTFHSYGDDTTIKLIGTVAKVLGVPVTTVLEVFGDYFLTYCMEHGYDKMLLTLGDNLFTFIQNLDSLHALLAMSYKKIDAPSFRCEQESDNILILHYYSSRKGLYPIVTGTVKAVARDLFNEDVTCEVLEVTQEQIISGVEQHHAVFRLEIKPREDDTTSQVQIASASKSFIPDESLITAPVFCELFPYHIVFNDQLQVTQLGINIQKMLDRDMHKATLSDIVTLIQPRMDLTFEWILKFINAIFIFEIKEFTTAEKDQSLALAIKGQVIYRKDLKLMIFIGSPRLTSLNEMQEKGIFLSDIPLYDVTRELVLLNQQRQAEIEISKKLDETTAALTVTSRALEKEKQKTDMLLYQMLPEKVANSLKEGKSVNAEKFEESTILFSDIVTFTTIASVVAPIQIVDMLNELYLIFDTLTTQYNVYKVETIGDAYMVVGGLPERNKLHAAFVAAFGLQMSEQSQKVKSPATGKSIQIRVGIHSGPVVAGVVGAKMPRYCLFGDTVNTASRMESHGVPGRIHISPTTHKILENNKDFVFEERGELEVKGKGKMRTYFLLSGNTDNYLQADSDTAALTDVREPVKTTDISDTKSLNEKTDKDVIYSKTCIIL